MPRKKSSYILDGRKSTKVSGKVDKTTNDFSYWAYLVVLKKDWVGLEGSRHETIKANQEVLVSHYFPNGAPSKLVNKHMTGIKEYAKELKHVPCIAYYDTYYGVYTFFPKDDVKSIKMVTVVHRTTIESGISPNYVVIKDCK